jgi:hypothetical protein
MDLVVVDLALKGRHDASSADNDLLKFLRMNKKGAIDETNSQFGSFSFGAMTVGALGLIEALDGSVYGLFHSDWHEILWFAFLEGQFGRKRGCLSFF